MKSKMFSLNISDFWKSLIMAIGTPFLYWIQTIIPGWNIPAELKAAISAAITYIVKNFLTDDVKVAEKIAHENDAKIVPKDTIVIPKDKDGKIIPIILALMAFSFCGYSQSNFFSPIPKIKKANTGKGLIATATPEPTFWAIRPSLIAATLFIGGTVEAAGGAGIAYQNITQKGTDSRNYVNYDFGVYMLAGGSVVKSDSTKTDIEKIAFVATALNGTVGLGYALSKQQDLKNPANTSKQWKGGLALVWKINLNN